MYLHYLTLLFNHINLNLILYIHYLITSIYHFYFLILKLFITIIIMFIYFFINYLLLNHIPFINSNLKIYYF